MVAVAFDIDNHTMVQQPI